MGSKPWNFRNGPCCDTRTVQTLKFFATNFGGGKRDRTADLLHAMQALSQLSYTPFKHCKLPCNCVEP